jgi:protein FAM50
MRWKAEQEKLKSEPLEITYSYFDGSGHRKKITVTKGTTIMGFLEAMRRDLKGEYPALRGALPPPRLCPGLRLAILAGCAPDNLLYVKEDLILPHHMTFWDFIVTKVGPSPWQKETKPLAALTSPPASPPASPPPLFPKARGKSGPLFAFDVHAAERKYTEVNGRQVLEQAVESHPGKVSGGGAALPRSYPCPPQVVERAWYERNKMDFPTSRCGVSCLGSESPMRVGGLKNELSGFRVACGALE